MAYHIDLNRTNDFGIINLFDCGSLALMTFGMIIIATLSNKQFKLS